MLHNVLTSTITRLLQPLSLTTAITLALTTQIAPAQELKKPDHPFFAPFHPLTPPAPSTLLLHKGDRLAICGDSITEQKMYSRAIETYLTVCTPELEISTRQYGWGGETAEGFLRRMTNDCLRFHPTIATTCYGMNDHRYTTYSEANAAWYQSNQLAIVRSFKSAGSRVLLGSAGCVGPKVPWSKSSSQDMNLNLCELRNHNIRIAQQEKIGFADVFWPMFTAGFNANQKYGDNYNIAGGDGVHPGWSGSFIMAYAFLKGFGLHGEIGTFTVDLQSHTATASSGHAIQPAPQGGFEITSKRYPFCAGPGEPSKDDNIRSAWSLVPFNDELNRLKLVAKNATAAQYTISWGDQSKTVSGSELSKGVNLMNLFEKTPFDAAFKKVDEAVAKKQAYETKQIKNLFHGEEGRADMEATVALTEKARAPLVAAIATAFQPVTHTLKIEAKQ